MSARKNPSDSSAAAGGRGRRRWIWILGGFVALILLVVLVAPVIAAPIVKGLVIDGVHESMDATASLDDLSLSIGGHLEASGFRLVDAAGQSVTEVEHVDVRAGVLGALTGSYSAQVIVDGLSVHARQDEAGEWNLVTMTSGGSSAEREKSGRDDDEESELPDLSLGLEVRDGVLTVHALGGRTELRDLNVTLDITDLSEPAPFHVSGRVVGPAGPGGELSLDGTVTLAKDGRLDPAGVQADLDYILRDLMLAAVQPALAALVPLDEVSGLVEGTGHWSWRAPLTLSGGSTLTMSDVILAGPAVGPEPIVLPAASLTAEATMDALGEGTQIVTLDAGDLLTLRYGGSTQVVGDEQRVTGTLEAGGRLAGLLVAARERLGIKPTVLLDGALEIRSDVEASWNDDGVLGAGVDARVSLLGLRAESAGGVPLDLGELTELTFDLKAGADLAAGTAQLERLQLDAGPVTASAQAQITGLPTGDDDEWLEGLALADSNFTFDADLDRLQQSIGSLLEPDTPRFGGRIVARSTGRSDGDAMLADSTLELTGLELRDSGDDDTVPSFFGPLDLSLEQAGRLDFSVGGRTDLERFVLRSPALNVDASGSITDIADAERIRGTLEHLVEVQPGPAAEMVDRLFGGFFGLAASGQPVTMQNTLTLDGPKMALVGRMAMPEFVAQLGTDAEPIQILGMDTGYDVRVDQALAPIEIAAFDLALAGYLGSGLTTGALDVSGSGSIEFGTGQLTLHAEPRFAGPEILALDDGTWVGGAPFGGVLDLRVDDQALVATGRLAGNRLEIGLPAGAPDEPARRIEQQDVDMDFLVTVTQGAEELLDVTRFDYNSLTARTSLHGTLGQYSVPDQTVADMEFSVSGEIARLLADAGALLPMAGTDARGALTLDGKLIGDAGALTLDVDGRVKDLWLAVAPGDAGADGAEPIIVSDPNAELALSADVLTGPLDVTLTRGRVDTSFLQGGFTGEAQNLRAWLEAEEGAAPAGPVPVRLDVDMTYDSQQLGALLGAALVGHFTGEGRHPLKLTLSGDLASVDALGVAGLGAIAGMDANGTIGLAPFQLPGLLAAGELGIDLTDGVANLIGDMTLNEGSAKLDAALDLRPEENTPRSRVGFKLDGLNATREMGPLLASMHPLFAAGGDADVGSVTGAIAADFELVWDGVLNLAESDLASVPLERLSGKGRVEFPDVTLSGSPLLGQMLGKLGEGEQKKVSVAPMSFRIKDGRLGYAEPWPWKVSGEQTNFTGSVGLDGSLDLDWNVPITERLMEKHKFLRKMKGEMLAIPIRGSVDKPKMKWDDVFEDLAEKALKAELEDRLKDKLGGGLGGVLLGGGDDEDEDEDKGDGGGDEPQAESLSPEDLLAKADALWKQGSQDEARPLYKELKEKHKLTLVYVLNKDRIRKRARDP